MAAVLNQGQVKALLSDDQFSVDGTLIEAWASMKSFRPKDGSGEPPRPQTPVPGCIARAGPARQACLSGACSDGERARFGGGSVAGIRAALRQVRPAADSPRETASCVAVAGLLFGAVGAAVDGAARLQSAVPLVCRVVAGCRGVGRHGVHQEPRTFDRGRH